MSRKPVARIPAKISSKTKRLGFTENDSFESVLYLSKGSEIMLRTNLWVEKGLVNGSVGKVVDIIFHRDATPQDPPSILICTFDSYKGPYLDPESKTVPIASTQLSHESDHGDKIIVSQFPVCLNYACTIHKSQGLTMEKAYVQIGETTEMRSGLTYVALSGIKSLDGLLLEPFNFLRCLRINRSTAIQKKQQWLRGLKQK